MGKARHVLALASAISVAAITPAHAYLDPGTGSIILQAVIGGVAATLFIARGYIYRLKGWLGLMPKAADQNPRTGQE